MCYNEEKCFHFQRMASCAPPKAAETEFFMIRIQGLTKDFPLSGKKADSRTDMRTENGKTFYRAVDSLSLHIEKGEIFGLLGANGAGKTTTLRLLATMLRPTAGSAEIAGFDIVRQSEKRAQKASGILFGGDTLAFMTD